MTSLNNNNEEMYPGDENCPCIDASSTLISLNRTCELSSVDDNDDSTQAIIGVKAVNGLCYPSTYGSNYCDLYDYRSDPACTSVGMNGIKPPDYCFESFCYVDYIKCKLSSNAVAYTDYFPGANGLYYSYNTCNSTGKGYFDFVTTNTLSSKRLRATVPGSLKAHHFKIKQGTSSETADYSGDEYYNDTIPYQGSLIDYVNSIIDYTDGSILGIDYTYRSKGSDSIFTTSSYTASVNDVRFGLSDIAIGNFWVTAERLRLTAFSTTIQMDRNVLVVPRPEVDNSLAFQTEKLLEPFETQLWLVLLLCIYVAAILGVWFTSPTANQSLAWLKFRKVNWKTSSFKRRLLLVCRLVLDGFLEKGMYFCGGSVEQDSGASLPHKLLMFGFSFLILIAVSAYVANLAAFLTRSGISDFIDSVQKATKLQTPICANTVLKEELTIAWPDTNFIFFNADDNVYEDLDYFADGLCEVILVSESDKATDTYYNQKLCDNNLVYTDAVVLEIPTAFPINKDLAPGWSYWMFEHAKQGMPSFADMENNYKEELQCDYDVYNFAYAVDDDTDDNQLTIENMAFAFMFFAVFALIAIALQLYLSFGKSKNKDGSTKGDSARSFLGRSSDLHSNFISTKNFDGLMELDEDEIKPPKGTSPGGGDGGGGIHREMSLKDACDIVANDFVQQKRHRSIDTLSSTTEPINDGSSSDMLTNGVSPNAASNSKNKRSVVRFADDVNTNTSDSSSGDDDFVENENYNNNYTATTNCNNDTSISSKVVSSFDQDFINKTENSGNYGKSSNSNNQGDNSSATFDMLLQNVIFAVRDMEEYNKHQHHKDFKED